MEKKTEEQDPVTERSIECAIAVHTEIGPGVLERPYAVALAIAVTGKSVGLIVNLNRPRPVDGIKRVAL